MKVVLIRHGEAGDRHAWQAQGRDDRLRPLTPEGRKKMQQAAAGLTRLVPAIGSLATSPWVRAAETAAIVAAAYGAKILTLNQLTPEHKPDEVVRWLREERPADPVALVGHEPHLSTLAAHLLTGRLTAIIDLEKSGACLVDLTDPPQPGSGTLRWLLTGRELTRLGE